MINPSGKPKLLTILKLDEEFSTDAIKSHIVGNNALQRCIWFITASAQKKISTSSTTMTITIKSIVNLLKEAVNLADAAERQSHYKRGKIQFN